MKILIIGGTKFLGRHLINVANKRNHTITLFNRGKYSSENFENVEQIHGDRNFDLDKLSEQNWDAVIDTCGYLPNAVDKAVEVLKDNIGHYILISSISAYSDVSQPNFDENTPLSKLNDEQLKRANEIDVTGEINGMTLGDLYGGLKVLCENAVETELPNRSLIIRAGLIVGAYDTTDRFTYWVDRTVRGGEILAPGNPNRFVQFIDAFDLARWIIKMIENQTTGIFNATGKPFSLTMESLLSEIKAVSQSNAKFTWVSEDFLNENNIAPWSEMPLYLPESDEESKGFLAANIDKALQFGLELRPLNETISDILIWRENKTDQLKAGISSEKEIELISKWREQT